MDNYVIFAGRDYYPCGGLSDYVGEANTLEEAMEFLLSHHSDLDWYQIGNILTFEVVKKGKIG